jgi:hypothetical protein
MCVCVCYGASLFTELNVVLCERASVVATAISTVNVFAIVRTHRVVACDVRYYPHTLVFPKRLCFVRLHHLLLLLPL